jgi:hypothetical protein
MRHSIAVWATLLWCAGCTPKTEEPGPNGRDGGTGGGGGGAEAFTLSPLDANAKTATYFAVAADPVSRRLGIAYYSAKGTETNAGVPDFDLKYLEWNNGQVSAPQTIRKMQRLVGLAAAFQSNGEPAIAHLGGADTFVPGQSIFWFQSDAALSTRSGSTWTETAVATQGDEATCGNVVSDRGTLVGLWPALVVDADGTQFFAWRDGHDGQYPQQDWGGSDLELAEGKGGAWSKKCVASGEGKSAWGGRISMTLSKEGPALVHDQTFGGADTTGQNVVFQKRKADGSWTGPATVVNIANTQSGASLAWDEKEGFGIAVVERASSELKYLNSLNGSTWSAVDPVYGAGSGGWYPALAMDPINHEPAIAFYVCSSRANVNESQCVESEDDLRVTQRIDGKWRQLVVDVEGGFMPKLGFFSDGKKWLVYRHPKTGALKIAVER